MANQSKASEFMSALVRFEEDGDVERIAALFGAEAELINPTLREPLRGKDGARAFWKAYRDTFGEIRSDFRLALEADSAAILEWTSQGRAPDGRDLSYAGVSVIEFDGDEIARFRAYFDPRALGEQLQAKKRAA